MLKYRVITGAFLISFVGALILYASSEIFSLATLLFFVLATFEWTGLAGIKNKVLKIVYSIVLTGLYLLLYKNTSFHPYAFYAAIIFWASIIIVLLKFPKNKEILKNQILSSIVGAVILIPSFLALNLLSRMELLFLIATVSSIDIGAYFIGRSFGKRLLIPNVSPKKTKEGCAGGLLGALCVFPLSFYLNIEQLHNIYNATLFLLLILYFSIIGDLTESVFKRTQNIKDSGSILPGHGGILDRLDSIMPAAVFFLIFIKG